MSNLAHQLYHLLPAIYRIRDLQQGEPLKALLDAIAQQVGVLEEDLAQLYDDQFIETCADWAIPYIGDLIGYQSLHHSTATILSPRAEVANTIGYRRRKGTAAVLEQLAADVTGWKAHVVEFFQLLIATQFLNHVRLENRQSPDLRQWRSLERLNTAFDQLAHTVDVRRIASQRGRHNIPNIGIFLWRLQSYPITRSTARSVNDEPDPYFQFHPLGIDTPLFNQPQTETAITQLSQPINVPHPLSRRELYEELEARRQAIVDRNPSHPLYFQEKQLVFQVFLDDTPIPPEEILICNLSEWRRPPNQKTYRSTREEESSIEQALPIRVAVDPVLGRLSLPEAETPERVEVSYSYAFSHDIGGGPYDRSNSVFSERFRTITWQIGVLQTAPEGTPQLVRSLAEAIATWNDQSATETVGIIAIMDNHTYDESLSAIQMPRGSQLMIVAADWPVADQTAEPERRRVVGQLSPEGLQPHIIGNLEIRGTGEGTEGESTEGEGTEGEGTEHRQLILNGLLLEGSVQLPDNAIRQLQIDHCTLTSGILRTASTPATQPLELSLNDSICRTLKLPHQEGNLKIRNCIIGRPLPEFAGEWIDIDKDAIAGNLSHLDIQTSTVLGFVNVRTIEASNSIFIKTVTAQLRQIGCVRFSYIPLDSPVPRRYRCQPTSASDAIRVKPQFTSLRYGDPGYCQLSLRCALEIRQGADDESEMGVFHDLYQLQREANLRTRLDEYLRIGLEAGIFYAT